MKFKKLFIVSFFILILSMGVISACEDIGDNNVLGEIDNSQSENLENTDVNLLNEDLNEIVTDEIYGEDESPTDEEKSFDDIKQMINDTEEGGTIELNGTYLSEKMDTININKSLTIEGKGALIKSTSLYDFLIIDSGNVVLKNLKFDCIAISGSNANLSMINCTIQNIYYYGCYALSFNGGTLELNNTIINDVDFALESKANSLSINNCMFTNIRDSILSSKDKTVSVVGSTFSGDCGMEFTNDKLTFKNSNFTFKSAEYLEIYSKNVDITGCKFNNADIYSTKAGVFKVSGSSFVNSGFEIPSSNITIDKSTLKKFSLDVGGKGNIKITNSAIQVSLSIGSSKTRPIIDNCTFSNFKMSKGFALSDCFEGPVTIKNCKFINNTGPLFNIGKDFNSFTNCEFTNNNFGEYLIQFNDGCKNFTLNNCKFIKNKGKYLIKHMDAGLKELKITNCAFEANQISKYLLDIGKINKVTINKNTFMKNNCVKLIYWEGPFMEVKYNNRKNSKYASSFTLSYNVFSRNLNKNRFAQVFIEPDISTHNDDYIIISKVNLKSNYYGTNIQSVKEFYTLKIFDVFYIDIEKKTNPWVNLKILRSNTKYTLKFVDSKTGKVVKMPSFKVNIINKNAKKTVQSNVWIKNGVGSFTLDKAIALNSINIVDSYSTVLNKPKAKITLVRRGSDFQNNKVILTLKNGKKAIANRYVYFTVNAINSENRKENHGFYVRTNKKGQVVFKGDKGYQSQFIYHPGYKKISLTVIYSDVNYGYSKAQLKNMVIKPVKCVASMNNVAGKAGKNYIKVKVRMKKYKAKLTRTFDIKFSQANKRGSYRTFIKVKNGVGKIKIPKLAKGKYKMVLTDDDCYRFPNVKRTLTIK